MASGPHNHSYSIPTATRGSHDHPEIKALQDQLAILQAAVANKADKTHSHVAPTPTPTPTPIPTPTPTPTPTPGNFPTYAQRTVTILSTDTRQQAQDKWAAAPDTAIVGFQRGTHDQDFYRAKPGQTFVGELDSQTADQWFPEGRPITKLNPTQDGATLKGPRKVIGFEVLGVRDPDCALDVDAGTTGIGLIAYIWSHHNRTGGIGFSGNVEVAYSLVEDNGRTGIKGRTMSDADIRNGGYVHHLLSRRNNANFANDPAWEAGGSKFLNHNNFKCEDSEFSDNGGPGFWIDRGGSGNVARRVKAYRNHGSIFWEITQGGLIEDCEAHDLTAMDNRVAPGALYLSNSAGVTVRRTKIVGHRSSAALALKDEPSRTPRNNANIIEDCDIYRLVAGGFNCAVWGFDGNIDTGTATATFRRNKYHVATAYQGNAWGWKNPPGRTDWATWRGMGYDLDSTLSAT